jgi:hypothetical protein
MVDTMIKRNKNKKSSRSTLITSLKQRGKRGHDSSQFATTDNSYTTTMVGPPSLYLGGTVSFSLSKSFVLFITILRQNY